MMTKIGTCILLCLAAADVALTVIAVTPAAQVEIQRGPR